MHIKKERTLVIIKPDGVQRSLIGDIITRFERVGLKLAGMKMVVPTKEQAEKHYTLDPNWKKDCGEKTIKNYKEKGKTPPSEDPIEIGNRVLKSLSKYITSGPVILIILEGAHSVKLVRKLVGGTEPLSSDVGTIRGDYVLDSYQMADSDGRAVRNIVHASGSVNEAEMEIVFWFNKKEVIDYKIVQEKIIYDVNLDGILE